MISFKQWLEDRKAKKIKRKEKMPTGCRDLRKDLSKDYPGNLANMGTVYPFKLLGKK
jgi:hypothetical protein